MSGKSSWANPSPAGLVALAVATWTFYALLTGKMAHSCYPLMGMWLIGGFFIQVIVGIIELNKGGTLGGNLFTFFSAFFMFATGANFLIKYFGAQYGWQMDARVDGWAWLAIAFAVTMWAPAYLTGPKCLFGVVVSLTPALWVIAFMDMGVWPAKTWAPIAGYLALSGGAFGIYTSAAIVLNTTFGRTILPTGAPFIKPKPAPAPGPVSKSKSV